MIVLEWMRYLWERMHFILRNARDVQLGDKMNHLLFGHKKRASWAPKMAQRYIALMVDPGYRERHQEALTRAGH